MGVGALDDARAVLWRRRFAHQGVGDAGLFDAAVAPEDSRTTGRGSGHPRPSHRCVPALSRPLLPGRQRLDGTRVTRGWRACGCLALLTDVTNVLRCESVNPLNHDLAASSWASAAARSSGPGPRAACVEDEFNADGVTSGEARLLPDGGADGDVPRVGMRADRRCETSSHHQRSPRLWAACPHPARREPLGHADACGGLPDCAMVSMNSRLVSFSFTRPPPACRWRACRACLTGRARVDRDHDHDPRVTCRPARVASRPMLTRSSGS